MDARLTLGSGAGAITVERGTNSVRDLIPGVTLTLDKEDAADPVTVSVDADTTKVVETIQEFVKQYNSAIQYFNEQFDFDPDSGDGGTLTGQRMGGAGGAHRHRGILRPGWHDHVEQRGPKATQGQLGQMHIERTRLGLGQDGARLAPLHFAQLENPHEGVDPLRLDPVAQHRPSAVVPRLSGAQSPSS